jgi:exo-beta-1,3-glucanase (GH17 family)
MSLRKEKLLSLTGVDANLASDEKLHQLFSDVMQNGMHGIGFSAYEEGQEPGDKLTEEQIRRRMSIIAPHTTWIRSFSCTDGNELIPKIAHEFGLKTLVGAWLAEDHEKNQIEIEGLIKLTQEGFVNIAAVGNEVLYREELTEEELLDYIRNVKKAIPNIPVSYVDAYYEFENRPALTKLCDVILTNCYPFWEGCAQEYALLYMKDMYRRTKRAAGNKPVIISETGWPNKGDSFHGAFPSQRNAISYFVNAQKWSMEDDIPMFYFSSFDESWKVGDEGDVGAYWGLWDKDEQLKY